jgi:S-(hydroxymethyl)glutathione dehydrogenase/alcohol dehydrogenase
MKALVFHKPKDIRLDFVADPRIENARDIILKVTSSSICGSDLHIYNGYAPQKKPLVLGHEFMGIVQETGPQITNLKRGDRVVVPFPISCGHCWFCERGLPGHCEKSNPAHYGPDGKTDRGGGLFGYTDQYGPYSGGQAQYVRVPFGDVGPRKIPEDVPDERVLFLSDILPTGWIAAEWCEIKRGETVAVFGCGPVGLMAMKAARLMGAGRVIAVDVLDYRRKLAKRVADAETIDPNETDCVEAIRHLTHGRGADACIDAVGMEADHGLGESVENALRLQVGSIKVLRQCIKAVRRGGVVSAVGVYMSPANFFPLDEIFEKGLRLRAGQAPAQAVLDQVFDLAMKGVYTAEDIVTHRMPLDDGPRAYKMFNDKEDGCVKVVLRPWDEEVAEQDTAAELQSFAEYEEMASLSETLYGETVPIRISAEDS